MLKQPFTEGIHDPVGRLPSKTCDGCRSRRIPSSARMLREDSQQFELGSITGPSSKAPSTFEHPVQSAPPSVTSADEAFASGNAAEIQILPPVDRGRDAWLFLAAAFTIEFIVSGWPSSIVSYLSFIRFTPR